MLTSHVHRFSRAPRAVALVALAIIFFAAAPRAAADVLHVPGDYPTIQAAIEAASDGDEVLVAPGTYTGPGNVNISFLGKAITVRSAEGPDVTLIDCGNQNGQRGFQFTSGEGLDSVLDGFTISDGFHVGNGGGILISSASPTIRNCVLTNCNGYNFGGGIFISSGSPAIVGCIFSSNFVDFFGGGIYVQGNSQPTIVDSEFTRNIALAWGGGIFTTGSNVTLTIENCIFSGNDGGGVRVEGGNVSIANSVFAGNPAHSDAGGVRVTNGHADIVNCTFFQNSAMNIGGLHAPSSVTHNSIFWQNLATGSNPPPFNEIASAGNPVVNNSIVQGGWNGDGRNNIDADPLFEVVASGTLSTAAFFEFVTGHTVFYDATASFEPGALAGLLFNPNTANSRILYIDDNTADSILVRGNLVGAYSQGHLAIAPTGDEPYIIYNVRPPAGSPAVDTGDNNAVPPHITTDLDGNPRIVDGNDDGVAAVDLGAYELQPDVPAIPGDLTGNGSVGVEDLLILLGEWGACAACGPVNCPADLDGDCAVGVADLLILLANWG